MRVFLTVLIGGVLVCGQSALARAHPRAPVFTIERTVLLMRHGVRPPTKSPPLPAGIATAPWPSWPVRPGELTPHGAAAIRLLAAYDRQTLAPPTLARGACPPAGAVRVYSDSDQRTLATGDAWLESFAPGCPIANVHLAQDTPDPLFEPIKLGVVSYDAKRADADVRAALKPGGVAAIEQRHRAVLRRLDAIYCGPAPRGPCGVSAEPSRLAPPDPKSKPKIEGALDRGSTAGQILLLEYADGKPMTEVGWGRATPADIEAASALHAVEYTLAARQPYVAAASLAPLLRRMLASLTAADGQPAIDLIVGHDSNVAALGGLFDLHWKVPGLARDDPAPGGGIGFQLLRGRNGKRFVRAFYRAQGLEQIRALTPLTRKRSPYMAYLPIAACGPAHALACPLETFTRLARDKLRVVE